MPSPPGPSNGPFQSVAAMPVRFGALTFLGASSLSTTVLASDGLPGLNAWFRQTTAPGTGVTVQLEFQNGVVVDGTPNWQPLIPAYALAFDIPSLTNVSLGSTRYRATLTSNGMCTVRYQIVPRIS